MSKPQYEDLKMHEFMAAPLGQQVMQLRMWSEPEAGLLILMSACEGQCFFCAQPVVTHPPPEMVTPWEQISRKLEDNRRLGLRTLLIGGTEPPTHPDFHRTLELAEECGFEDIQLMTSGLQLVEKGRRWFCTGVRSVCTPLYALEPEVHDSVVGVSGHWQRAVRGLDAAASLGMDVFIHTLALNRTLPQLPEFADWVYERWRRPLALAPLRPKPGVFEFETAVPSLLTIKGQQHANLSLVGFPACLGTAGESALLTRLYFRSQSRTFGASCSGCGLRPGCSGIVRGYLERWGEAGLEPA